MIVYNDVKGQFVYDVKNKCIADKIYNAVRAKGSLRHKLGGRPYAREGTGTEGRKEQTPGIR